MASSIKSLLGKKGWTGEEVGKALIASLLNDIKNQGREYEPLFTQADFDKMESSLSTDRDFLAYGVYRDIYSSLVDTYNRASGLCQQFYNGYYRYLMHLKDAMTADEALQEVENYPLIMTAEQYTRLQKETLERKKMFGESYYTLLFSLLEDFLNALDNGEADKVPADIRQAIEATKTEPAKGHALYSSYNELMGEGYYTLPDGRRSDKMTTEEWQEALKEFYLKSHSLTIDGKQASPEETLKYYNQERLLKGYELFFNGVDGIKEAFKEATGKDLGEGQDEEILGELSRILEGTGKAPANPDSKALAEFLGENSPTEWHIYTDAPEGLTAYDLLDLITDSSRYAETDEKEHLKTFKNEYPTLYTALDAYIREAIPKAKSLKATQLYKDFIGWGELAELKIADFETLLQPADEDIIQLLQERGLKFADQRRAFIRGIAIIQNPQSWNIDENGNYIGASVVNPLRKFETIENLGNDNNARLELDALRNNLFIPALSYIYAFNALVELVGAVYDIDGMEEAKVKTALYESQLEAFNSTLYMFYYNVYGDKEEQTRKRELIKELFVPVYIERLKPTEEDIADMKVKLSKLGTSTTARKTLSDFDSLIAELNNGEGA